MTINERTWQMGADPFPLPAIRGGHIGKDRSPARYEQEEWLAWRRTGIGGSDVSTIMDCNPYKGWLGLYVEKLDLGLDPTEPMEAAYWGQQLENLVALEFEKRSGLRVVETHDLFRHPRYPYMIATPDRFVVDPTSGRYLGVLEVKTASARRSEEWADGPAEYARLQLLHYLAVVGAPRGWVAVLLGGQRFQMYEVVPDPDETQRIIAEEGRFWRHVETRTPPEPDAKDSTTQILNARWPANPLLEVDLDGEAAAAAMALRENSLLTAADAEKKRLQNVVRAALGEGSVGLVDGEKVVSWKTEARSVFDLVAFSKDHPELAERYRREASSRVFRVHRVRKAGDPLYEEDPE